MESFCLPLCGFCGRVVWCVDKFAHAYSRQNFSAVLFVVDADAACAFACAIYGYRAVK